jgi:hypothetical protein
VLPIIEDIADNVGDSELTVESNGQVIDDGDALSYYESVS